MLFNAINYVGRTNGKIGTETVLRPDYENITVSDFSNTFFNTSYCIAGTVQKPNLINHVTLKTIVF